MEFRINKNKNIVTSEIVLNDDHKSDIIKILCYYIKRYVLLIYFYFFLFQKNYFWNQEDFGKINKILFFRYFCYLQFNI